MAVTESVTGQNINAFTTTAGTESVVAVVYSPYNNPQGFGNTVSGVVTFGAINAATTQLIVRVRQASFAAGALVVTTPTGALLGVAFTKAFTAGTVSNDVIPFSAFDPAPITIPSTGSAPSVPAQAATLNMPGVLPEGSGVAYVVTVASTTNVATVAALGSTVTLIQGNPGD